MASQRGLSGINNANNRKAQAGNAAAQNIQRQARSMFQAVSSLTNSQLTICAPRMPTTMVSWLSDTSLPLTEAGATSAIYIGDNPEAMPIAMPPKKRITRNGVNVSNAPVP